MKTQKIEKLKIFEKIENSKIVLWFVLRKLKTQKNKFLKKQSRCKNAHREYIYIRQQ
jgi:hypothetical protein